MITKPKPTPEQAWALMEYYRDGHQVDFVREMLGRNPWKKQEDIINDVFKYKYVGVASCNAAGKSDVASDIVLAFLLLYPNSIVITTAPTWRQVKDVLWRYIRSKHKKAPIKLSEAQCNQVGLDLSEDWYAIGLSTTESEKFFGYHADHILVVVDEASGVMEKIWIGVDAVTPNVNAHVLGIGNPTDVSGRFYRMMNDPLVKKHKITVFDTPNFTANGIETVEDLLELFTPPDGVDSLDHIATVQKSLNMPIPGLISPDTVYRRYFEWGQDSPAWQALIMGEFPSQAEQALFPADLVRMAMEMNEIDKDSGKTYAELSGWDIPDGAPELGVDMARFGGDSTVATPRRGGWVDKQVVWNKVDLMTSADRILDLIDPLDFNARVDIDDTGNGGGTTDRLVQLKNQSLLSGQPVHQYQIAAYNFSSKEMMGNPLKFHDITAELYWNLRTQFLNKNIALHYDEQLYNELIGRRWRINSSGKIQVESKEDYKKRTGGKSPDRSDSLALAFAGGIRKVRAYVPDQNDYDDDNSTLKPITSGLNRGW
jgi:hypothetical protein